MKLYGNGSVSKAEPNKTRSKCRKWRLRVKTSDGETTRRFHGTYSEAEEALKLFIAELSTPVTDVTFSEYADKWLERRRLSNELASSTLRKNKQQINTLCKEFGNYKLHDITKSCAEDGLLHIKHYAGTHVYSGTSMNQFYSIMKTILESAIDDELIQTNPLARMKPPKIDHPKRKALSRESLARFMCALDNMSLDSYTIGLRIAVLAGLRRGEMMALQWLDLEDNLLHVRKSLTEYGKELKAPKTPSGIRDVPISDSLIRDLKSWKQIQAKRLSILGVEWTEETPIVMAADGGYMNPQNFERWWRRHRSSFGLDGVVLHELRHTYLTMLANEGTPSQVLKSLAGWSSIAMADVYVHNDKSANNQAVAEYGNMLDFEKEKIKKNGVRKAE